MRSCIPMKGLPALLKKITRLRVLVVGDLMLDASTPPHSPEAPRA